jgi:hypothetical protein
LGTLPSRVLVSSTGVIGVQLPVEKIEAGIVGMSQDLQRDPLVGAEGIMTTDTHPKALSASVGDATITWVAKGSGMIEPNMATMLSYIFTDAAFDAATLDRLLRDGGRDLVQHAERGHRHEHVGHLRDPRQRARRRGERGGLPRDAHRRLRAHDRDPRPRWRRGRAPAAREGARRGGRP